MNRSLTAVIAVAMLLIIPIAFISGCAKKADDPEKKIEQLSPEEKAYLERKALFSAKCGFCHDLDRIEKAQYKADEWESVVKRMYQHDRGANLTPDDYEPILEYLKETYK